MSEKYVISKQDGKQLIERYEYIKNIKQMNDVDKLIDIINNTNWDAISNNKIYCIEASAPPVIQSFVPIAIATPIENKMDIKDIS
jgi:hypothetical protein